MKKFVRLIVASLSLTVAGAAFSSSQVSAATGTITTELTIDCIADADKDFRPWVLDGTITVASTNCDYYNLWSADGEPLDDGPATSQLTLNAGEYLMVWKDGEDMVRVFTGIVYEGRTPPGELQYRQDVTIPLDARTFDAGAVDDEDEGEHWLGGKKLCALDVEEGGRHVYTTLNITIDRPGRYTFRSIATDPLGEYLGNDTNPIGDSFLALYSSFDPANPDEGVIGCNDDLNNLFDYDNVEMVEVLEDGTWMEGHQPYFSVQLEPGAYTLLMTTWRAVSKAEWNAGDAENELPWTPGPATLTYELWGPAEAICVENDPVCDPPESTLPPTGSSSGPAAPIALIAVMLGLVGVFAVKRRFTS
ncbi:MAG: hypothetical protein EBU84_10735 [Actinobacteria bacterium]|nr:hypothetical protein [Actinomycetota bacterium]